MKTFRILLVFFCFDACSNAIFEFRQNAEGQYKLLSDETQTFYIDNSGAISGESTTSLSQLDLFFLQAESSTQAIYFQKVSGTKYYIPIKVLDNIIYSNSQQLSTKDVSFNGMTAFGEKISE